MNKNGDASFRSVDLDSHKIAKGSQPIFMDINSDTYVDFIYNQQNSGDHDIRVALYNTNSRAFETNSLGFLDNYVYKNTNVGCLEIPNEAALRLAVPNFSTLIDLNSDCVSDMYMVAGTSDTDIKGLSFIATKINTNSEQFMRYCLVAIDDLSGLNYTSPTFGDFDKDGTIDKLFYNYQQNSIHTYYNIMGSNSASSSSL
jgi:hypothetical protein